MWPEPCVAQERQRGLGDPQRAEQVGLELVAGVGLAELLDHAELAVAGVVDDDVEPAEVLVRLRDGGEVGVAVGDVELERQQPVAVLLDEVVEGGQVARGGGDRVAALEGGDRPLAAEAAGRAGDEPDLARSVLMPPAYPVIVGSPRPHRRGGARRRHDTGHGRAGRSGRHGDHRPARGAQRRRSRDREALVAAFRAFEADDDACRSRCSPARGGTFCAGADLKAIGTARGIRVDARRRRPDGPDPAAAEQAGDRRGQGHAVAGGLELALWADLRVAARDGGVRRVLPALGRAADRRGHGAAAAPDRDEPRDGPRADRTRGRRARRRSTSGLANRLVPAGEALAAAQQLARSWRRSRRPACGTTGCRCSSRAGWTRRRRWPTSSATASSRCRPTRWPGRSASRPAPAGTARSGTPEPPCPNCPRSSRRAPSSSARRWTGASPTSTTATPTSAARTGPARSARRWSAAA